MVKKPKVLKDYQIAELKIGAVVDAIYRPQKKSKYLRSIIAYRNLPYGASSGDFFWARKFSDCAVVVVGDASGHDAYASLVSAVIGLELDGLSRSAERSDRRFARLHSPRHVLLDLGERVAGVLNRAADLVRERGGERYAYLMSKEGFDAVSCVLEKSSLRISSAGLPVFVISSSGVVRTIGKYTPFKHITADGAFRKNVSKPVEITGRNRFLVFVSDGIFEQTNASKRSLGLAALKREIGKIVKKNFRITADELRDAVFAIADRHSSGEKADDDQLVVVLDLDKWRSEDLISH